MTRAAIKIQENDGIFEISIDRPERKNAFTGEMYEALYEALSRAALDDNVRVALIGGGGGNFSTGNDLQDFLQNPPSGEQDPVFRFLRVIAGFPKPLIFAVEGFAVGIGMTMLLHGDLVYAAPTARFQLPFVNLGLVPEAGSSYLLPLLIGHLKASEIFLLGDIIDAETAAAAGIVNQILPRDELLDFARLKAAQIASKPPHAVQQTKALLKKGHAVPLLEQMKAEETLFLKLLRSPDTIAFLKGFFTRKKS